MSKRIKVLNIIGCGRSGSTILGNTLGQVSGYEHIGELCYLWDRGMTQNALCGCGARFHDCVVWRGVLQRSSLTSETDRAAVLATFPRRATRRMALNVLLRRDRGELANGIGGYVQALRALYRGLHAETDCRVIVDSSKSPAHSYLLHDAPDLDWYVLHLVRDARAVAHSWAREVVRYDHDPDNPAPMIRFSPSRSAVKWSHANLSAELLRRKLGSRMVTVRYEDFLAEPREVLAHVLRLLGDGTPDPPLIRGRKVRLEVAHTVWGNPGRLRTGLVELRLDAEWREKMTTRDRLAVTGISWPLLLKYGYRLGTRGKRSHSNRDTGSGSRHRVCLA